MRQVSRRDLPLSQRSQELATIQGYKEEARDHRDQRRDRRIQGLPDPLRFPYQGSWTAQVLEAGDELTEGSVNPHDILKIKGVRAVQDYMLQEVQRVYRLQGVEISDKHIEVIVRQMLKKIRIEESGDSEFLPGTLVDILDFEDAERRR